MHEVIRDTILRSSKVSFHHPVGDKFAISCYKDLDGQVLDTMFLVPVDDYDEMYNFVKGGWGDKKVPERV